MNYCPNRFRTRRRVTREVRVGPVGVGGVNPLRLQSMTTSDTQDVAATVRQAIALAEVGCEIVRVTAPNVAAARCLREIRAGFSAAGFGPDTGSGTAGFARGVGAAASIDVSADTPRETGGPRARVGTDARRAEPAQEGGSACRRGSG